MKKTPIAIAVASAFGAAVAQAAVIPVVLVSASSESSNGSSMQQFGATTATWTFDTVSGVVSGSGFYQAQTQISPKLPGSLFTHNISDFSAGGGLAAGATSYACIEGTFGNGVFASLCGNYNYGANYSNESTNSYGPGTAASKTVGGDDVDLGPMQTIADYDGMTTSFNGTTVVISNAVPGSGGNTITFQAIPVPAAVWLFGSALGLLGWVRRRATV